jgi:hypothetical protein
LPLNESPGPSLGQPRTASRALDFACSTWNMTPERECYYWSSPEGMPLCPGRGPNATTRHVSQASRASRSPFEERRSRWPGVICMFPAVPRGRDGRSRSVPGRPADPCTSGVVRSSRHAVTGRARSPGPGSTGFGGEPRAAVCIRLVRRPFAILRPDGSAGIRGAGAGHARDPRLLPLTGSRSATPLVPRDFNRLGTTSSAPDNPCGVLKAPRRFYHHSGMKGREMFHVEHPFMSTYQSGRLVGIPTARGQRSSNGAVLVITATRAPTP